MFSNNLTSQRSRHCPKLFSFSRLANKAVAGSHWRSWLFAAGLAVSLSTNLIPTIAQEQTPGNAPAQLTTLLEQVDAAANGRNAKNVSEFYSPTFSHSDGLTRQQLQDALSTLWKEYPNMTYRTELKSWKQEANAIVATTVTHVTGTKKEGDREFKLSSKLESVQRVENQKIVRQDVVNETSEITSGANPPTLKINLPEQVRGGQEFSFDAIVQEPLGDDLLLGAALEETIKPEGFLNPTTVDLEPLNSGGIFKVGRAPMNNEQHWLSAVVVRHDGITMVTQRLKIIGRK